MTGLNEFSVKTKMVSQFSKNVHKIHGGQATCPYSTLWTPMAIQSIHSLYYMLRACWKYTRHVYKSTD